MTRMATGFRLAIRFGEVTIRYKAGANPISPLFSRVGFSEGFLRKVALDRSHRNWTQRLNYLDLEPVGPGYDHQ